MHTCQIGDCSEVFLIDHSKERLLLVIQIAHFCNFFATSKNTAPLLSILVWILVGLMTRWFILKIDGNISMVLHEKKLIVFYQNLEK